MTMMRNDYDARRLIQMRRRSVLWWKGGEVEMMRDVWKARMGLITHHGWLYIFLSGSDGITNKSYLPSAIILLYYIVISNSIMPDLKKNVKMLPKSSHVVYTASHITLSVTTRTVLYNIGLTQNKIYESKHKVLLHM